MRERPENKFPDMKNDCFEQSAHLPLQMGYFRPNEYCSRHDSPIEKLYFAGARTRSGGMITYGPGFNAAGRIAEDLGVQEWWPEPRGAKEQKISGYGSRRMGFRTYLSAEGIDAIGHLALESQLRRGLGPV